MPGRFSPNDSVAVRVRKLNQLDTEVSAGGPLRMVYDNENLVIGTNTQLTGHKSLRFTGTARLIIEGTGSLGIL